jgi:molecular chaperone GrpE
MNQASAREKHNIKVKMPDEGQEEPDLLETEIRNDDSENTTDMEKPFDKMSKQELIRKAEELAETAKRNYDLYLRSQADMDNLKKRAQRDKEDWIKFSNESLIRQLLPALDAMEQAVAHCNCGDPSLDGLKEGVELTLKGLNEALQKAGLEAVKAHGEPFDPNYHQAVSEMEDKSIEPGVVLQELQKGYLLNQRLLRPSMVVVNKKERADGEESGES